MVRGGRKCNVRGAVNGERGGVREALVMMVILCARRWFYP